MIFIYGLSDPRGGTVRYVGMTEDPHRRLAGHWSQSAHAISRSPVREWVLSLRLAGVRPAMVILEKCGSPERAESRELAWIRKLRREIGSLVNVEPREPASS